MCQRSTVNFFLLRDEIIGVLLDPLEAAVVLIDQQEVAAVLLDPLEAAGVLLDQQEVVAVLLD